MAGQTRQIIFVVTFEAPNEYIFGNNFISLRDEKRRKLIEISYNDNWLLWSLDHILVDFNSILAFELYPQLLYHSGNVRNG